MNATLPFFLRDVWLAPLFPLATAVLMLVAGRRIANRAIGYLCCGSLLSSFLFSCGAFLELIARPVGGRLVVLTLFEWFPAIPFHGAGGVLGSFSANWEFQVDPLSALMLLIVTGVGFLIHVYSIGYMEREGGLYRYFGVMNLFVYSMLTLVLAGNLAMLFVGWEGVGACSYLLIGFHFHKRAAADAGKKAFVVNRVCDAAFLLGIFLASATLGTMRFEEFGPALAAGHFAPGNAAITAIALLIFAGAVGKSAQIPLYIWLPDAMEGPTPVSALIHAATMVTAGVYIVARTSPIFLLAPAALAIVALVGSITALLAASMAVVQTDIKKVLAYSTISQLGYMFLACGVGAFAAGIFHLMTHAFFKSLLFLAAGSVIHALSGEQDLRKMGGLAKSLPVTYWVSLIAALTISGVFPFAGFLSKDLILGKAYEKNVLVWFIGYFTAGMTAFYMFRLIFLAFHGEPREHSSEEIGPHGSHRTMVIPMLILALLAITGGWIGWPEVLGGSDRLVHFLDPVMGAPTAARFQPLHGAGSNAGQLALMALSELFVGVGIFAAWYLYVRRTELPALIAHRLGRFHEVVWHGYYLNAFYNRVFVDGTKKLSLELGAFDRYIIDGVGVRGTASTVRAASRASMWWDRWVIDGSVRAGAVITQIASHLTRYVQTGLVQAYMLFIAFGLVGFLGYYFYLAAHAVH
ncbi:MAG: NADH-quinone oxidoreductase subunit L [Candidatus Acidiferrales bacterium]